MNVICNIAQCGFNEQGFCRQKTLRIKDGHCSFLFKTNGYINLEYSDQIEDLYKEKLVIIEGEKDNGIRCNKRSVNVNSKESENNCEEYGTKE